MTDPTAPTLDDLDRLARAAWNELPAGFRDLAGDVVIRVEDFAGEEILSEMGVEDPFELTGLYSGVDLTQRSVMDPAPASRWCFSIAAPSSMSG
jgi:predicted Zn-dependent protease with MMP-like domain